MSKKSYLMPTKSADAPITIANISKFWPWIIVAIIIVFIAAIRIRLLQIPLERDEGEFAYMGQLMLQGIPPYLYAYNMKLPGIYAAYALVMAIFGQTIAGIHLGLLIANAAAIILVFLFARRLFDNVAGVVAAASYGLLSVSPSVLGTSAHATQFIVPVALGGTLVLLKALDANKLWMLFISGLLYGLSFIIKQHAVFFIAFAVSYFIASRIRRRPINWMGLVGGAGLLLLASAIPFGISCVVLYVSGVFSTFWFWTFSYAQQYVSEVPFSLAVNNLLLLAPMAINPWRWLWAIAGIGLTAIFWDNRVRSSRLFLIGFALFSFLTICPGFFFRSHYFVTLLPAIAISAGVAISALKEFLTDKKMPFFVQFVPILIFAAAIIVPTISLSGFFFQATPVEACRMMYGENPFPESIEIAEYIKNHSTKDDTIAVIGSEPQIYFYADRKSATGYIYMYGLMELQEYALKMQLEMIREIETARPKYAVLVDVSMSWLLRPHSDMTILNWAQRYLQENYREEGIVSIVPGGQYKVYWDDEARRRKPTSPFNVYVFERKVL